MAHGFSTPTPVSGDNFWKNTKDLWDLLSKLMQKKAKAKADAKGGPLMAFQKEGSDVKAVQIPIQKTNVEELKNKPKALNMLQGSPVAKMLGTGTSDIVQKNPLQLPPGGPKLPPGVSPSGKGGTFTNVPGISAAPKKLDSEAFFKAAQTGVHPETGQYLNSEERKEYLKKSKAKMNAPASVAAAGASGISSIGEVTKGDEAIIGAVTELTHIVTSLVDAVKSQTISQQKIADREKATADRLANRSLAAAEEKSLEQTKQSSGTITPTGGIGGMALGGGKSSGGFGGPALGIGGKVLAKAVGKRGVGRVGTRLAAKYGGKVAAKAAGKFGAKQAEKLGVKAAGGAAAKMLGKKIPLLGLGLGSIFAVQRALKGDWLGAGLELASGAASTLPGLGTAGSVGLDAVLAARDMGATPFAKGGIISSPTLSVMGEGNKKEGVFPLQGREGKKTFEMFGQGMIDAQKKNKRDYANIQAAGLRQYYENQGGNDQLAKTLLDVFKNLKNFFFGGGDPNNPNNGPGGPGDFSGNSHQDQAMNYFMSQGLTKDQAAGIVGNLMQESTAALDPNADNKQGNRGIAQWDAGRYKKLEEYAKSKGTTATDFQTQLEFIMKELKEGGDGGKDTLKNIKAAQSSRQSAAAFLTGFERSGETAGSEGYENRMKNAEMLSKKNLSGGAGALAQAAAGLKGMSSASGPGGGNIACVWAVNKVFSKAGIPTPWGSSEYVPDAEKAMINAGYQQVSSPQPGDLYVAPGQKHIGVVMPNGKIISNSSSGAQFSWVGTVSEYNDHYKGNGKIYRMPGAVAARRPSSAPAVAASKPARTKSDLIGASPANQNTGTEMMATSAQVQMGAMGLTAGGGNVINNIYNTNGQQSNPISNSLTSGISANGIGLTWLALRGR